MLHISGRQFCALRQANSVNLRISHFHRSSFGLTACRQFGINHRGFQIQGQNTPSKSCSSISAKAVDSCRLRAPAGKRAMPNSNADTTTLFNHSSSATCMFSQFKTPGSGAGRMISDITLLSKTITRHRPLRNRLHGRAGSGWARRARHRQ